MEERSGENKAPATLTAMKWLFCLFILTGCYRNHLYVQQEWINSTFLASSKVGTPDPRTSNPPIGQRLLIAWDFPKSLFDQGLTLIATVRLWNNTQTTLNLPIDRKRDTAAFFFPNATSDIDRKILTYLVQVTTSNGEIGATWEHHFW